MLSLCYRSRPSLFLTPSPLRTHRLLSASMGLFSSAGNFHGARKRLNAYNWWVLLFVSIGSLCYGYTANVISASLGRYILDSHLHDFADDVLLSSTDIHRILRTRHSTRWHSVAQHDKRGLPNGRRDRHSYSVCCPRSEDRFNNRLTRCRPWFSDKYGRRGGLAIVSGDHNGYIVRSTRRLTGHRALYSA